MKSEDLMYLALNIFHEAASEPEDGKIAVGHVVMNRTKLKKFPNTVKEVVLQEKQFSWTNKDKRPKIHFSEYPALAECFKAAKTVLEMHENMGLLYDGADHYHANYCSPYWISSMVCVRKIGAHIFYRS